MSTASAFPQVERLFEAFHKGEGVFGKTRQNMPEYFHLRQVPQRDRVNVLTVTATIDYQTDADRLWQAAAETYFDPKTAWLFSMTEVARRNAEDVLQAMNVHGFTGRYPKNNAEYIWRMCRTFAQRYGGSPFGLLEKCRYDARMIHRTSKDLGDLPALTGTKILPFWLRILQDVGGIDLKNIQDVPLPVDVHVARSTLRVIYRSNRRPDVGAQREEMVSKWFEVCRSLGRPDIYPLALDEPLWFLSREGCSGTDDRSGCTSAPECVVREFCVFSQHRPLYL